MPDLRVFVETAKRSSCMVAEVGTSQAEPHGSLRVYSSFGFGRNIVGPAISQLIGRYPQLSVRFDVSDRLIDITSEGFDLEVRVGDEIAPPPLASGALVQLLPDLVREANVWAVYPSRLSGSAKLRVCVDWLEESLQALTVAPVRPYQHAGADDNHR